MPYKNIILPTGVAESWFHITAGGESYESRVCLGVDIIKHVAELCFGSMDEQNPEIDAYVADLANADHWWWCRGRVIGRSLACGEDPDIVISLIDDPVTLAQLKQRNAPRCDCWSDTDKRLSERGYMISAACSSWILNDQSLVHRHNLPLQRLGGVKLRSSDPKSILITHCPFCGQLLEK